MTNNKSRGSTATKIIAVLMTAVMLIAALFGIGYGLGWFSSSDKTPESSGGMVLGNDNEDASSNIKLTSSPLTVANSTAESTYTLTATISPAYVTNSDLTWSVVWDTTHDGYSSEDWYSDGDSDYSASSLAVTDFVSLSATTGSSVVVSCWLAFGCPVIITCTSDDNSSIKASCTADYQCKITNFYFTPTAFTLYSSSSSVNSSTNFALVTQTTAGTVAADYKVTYSVETRMEYIQDEIATNSSSYYNGRPTWLNYDAYLVDSETYTNTSYKTIYTVSTYWETFMKNFAVLSGTTYTESMMIDFYNALKVVGVSNEPIFYISAYLTDSNNKTLYSIGTDVYFTEATLNNFPTISVSSLTLNTSSIVF